MKKIGIITITNGNNYGNRLQNYGLQEFLKNNYECSVETLINNSNTIKGCLKKYILRNIEKNELKTEKESIKFNRSENFKIFNQENIDYSKITIDNFHKNKEILNYDSLVCGSDQIWNSYFAENDKANFGYFFKSQNVISYAASFGTNKIKSNKINRYRKYLDNLKFISVREDIGKEIVCNLTKRQDVEVLIDPAMLLTDKEWDKISKKPKQLKQIKEKKYILNYFLGELSKAKKVEIERVAKENNCEIINLLDENSPFYECGPSEFLYLEKNAFLICTDSFHSCVFAILYNRPFIIFDREQENIVSMNSRIETLINKFKLKNRRFNGRITKENLNHNYSEAYKILEIERNKSFVFLKKSLDLK